MRAPYLTLSSEQANMLPTKVQSATFDITPPLTANLLMARKRSWRFFHFITTSLAG